MYLYYLYFIPDFKQNYVLRKKDTDEQKDEESS